MRGYVFLATLSGLAGFAFAISSPSPPSDSTDPLMELAGIIMNNQADSLNDEELPDYITDIVRDFYSDTVVPDSVATDVLTFLEEVYSEHEFYEIGDWTESGYKSRYIPYKGELPDYSFTDFRLPVIGYITSPFGYREKFHRNHYGIDVGINKGDTIRAALPGVVVKSNFQTGGYGHYIVITHSGDVETVYAHLSSPLVYPGDKVKAGQPIAIGGSTGNASGPHLHFETRYLGIPVNPLSWFNLDNWLR